MKNLRNVDVMGNRFFEIMNVCWYIKSKYIQNTFIYPVNIKRLLWEEANFLVLNPNYGKMSMGTYERTKPQPEEEGYISLLEY
jgi:hypothetical protein